MRMPAPWNTSSKLRVNLRSLSRNRKRTGSGRSPSTHVTCRACCVTHSWLGCAVQPAKCTRRLATSMKNSTYNRFSPIVSTVKKSTRSGSSLAHVGTHPGSPAAPTGRTELFLAEDLPYRRRRDDQSQAFQFTHDALVTPTRVLARESQNEVSELTTRRPSPSSTTVRPAPGDQPPMPIEQGRRLDDE